MNELKLPRFMGCDASMEDAGIVVFGAGFDGTAWYEVGLNHNIIYHMTKMKRLLFQQPFLLLLFFRGSVSFVNLHIK
jgi:hypothetical protein